MGANSIQYSMTDTPTDGGMNEAVFAKNDDQALYFEPLGIKSYGAATSRTDLQGAAEFFWISLSGRYSRDRFSWKNQLVPMCGNSLGILPRKSLSYCSQPMHC